MSHVQDVHCHKDEIVHFDVVPANKRCACRYNIMHKLAIKLAMVLLLCSQFIQSQLDTPKPDKQAVRSNDSTSERLAGAVTATDAAAGRDTTARTSKPSTELSGSEYQQQTVERSKGSLAPLLWQHIQQQGQPIRRRAGLLPQAARFGQNLDLDQYDYEGMLLRPGLVHRHQMSGCVHCHACADTRLT